MSEARSRLFSLGDGNAPGPLSSVIAFLDLPSLGRCEEACKELRCIARKRWSELDEAEPNKSSGRGGVSAKRRSVRFHLASAFAARIEPEQARHCSRSHRVAGEWPGEWRVDCPGCESFPRRLCTAVYVYPEEYEIFVRFSRKEEGNNGSSKFNLLMQGFVPFRVVAEQFDEVELRIRLWDLNLSAWPDMNEAMSMEGGHDGNPEWQRVMGNAMKGEVAVTVVAIGRSALPTIELVSSECGFGGPVGGRSCYSFMTTIRQEHMLIETHAQEEEDEEVKPRKYLLFQEPLGSQSSNPRRRSALELVVGPEYYFGYVKDWLWD